MLLLQAPTFDDLLSGIGAGAVFTVWCVLLLHWVMEEVISTKAALVSVLLVIPLMYYAIFPPIPGMQAAIFLMVISTVAFLPQAIKYWEKRENARLDLIPLERSYAALATKPDNVQAAFDIAKWLASGGHYGEAILIATSASQLLSAERDPITNRSPRDVYERELRLLEEWRRTPHKATTPRRCTECGHLNPPGMLFCEKCGAPFILFLARKSVLTKSDFGRLVVGWCTVAAIIGVSAGYALEHPGSSTLGVFIILLVGSGVLALTFRSRAMLR